MEKKKTKKQTLRRAVKQKKTAVRASSRTKLRTAKSTKTVKADAGRPKVKPESVAPASALITEQKGKIQPLASRTLFAPKDNNERKWLIVDANGQTVGRLASEIAILLRGKHKACFTPNNDAGDFVVVLNAEKVKFTSNKEDKKKYYDHSGWVGGMKIRPAGRVRKEHPQRIIERAVHGMIARNSLGRAQMKKLKIYAGSEHPHAAQNPVTWALKYQGQKRA
ncbi:50S ribosomal protein L13 [bacterium]|nr:50S ribosomal protein L13 [bacterium]